MLQGAPAFIAYFLLRNVRTVTMHKTSSRSPSTFMPFFEFAVLRGEAQI